MSISSVISVARERVIRDMMPDRCTVTPSVGASVVVSGVGIETSSPPTPRTWRGASSIPCRVDFSRAFRPDGFRFQTTVADEFVLELPFDLVFLPTDLVTINGQNYQIRKTKDVSDWDVTIEVMIAKVSNDLDAF
jgi:hypothetical protein